MRVALLEGRVGVLFSIGTNVRAMKKNAAFLSTFKTPVKKCCQNARFLSAMSFPQTRRSNRAFRRRKGRERARALRFSRFRRGLTMMMMRF